MRFRYHVGLSTACNGAESEQALSTRRSISSPFHMRRYIRGVSLIGIHERRCNNAVHLCVALNLSCIAIKACLILGNLGGTFID